MLKKLIIKLMWYIWNRVSEFGFWIWCAFENEFVDIIIAGELEKPMDCKK